MSDKRIRLCGTAYKKKSSKKVMSDYILSHLVIVLNLYVRYN